MAGILRRLHWCPAAIPGCHHPGCRGIPAEAALDSDSAKAALDSYSAKAHPKAGTQSRPGALTVGEVLGFDLLRSAVVLAGQAGIGRPVERLNVMTVPDILPWAKPHEFMLTTGYPLPRSARQLTDLVRLARVIRVPGA